MPRHEECYDGLLEVRKELGAKAATEPWILWKGWRIMYLLSLACDRCTPYYRHRWRCRWHGACKSKVYKTNRKFIDTISHHYSSELEIIHSFFLERDRQVLAPPVTASPKRVPLSHNSGKNESPKRKPTASDKFVFVIQTSSYLPKSSPATSSPMKASIPNTKGAKISKTKQTRNVQQWEFAGGHPPNY